MSEKYRPYIEQSTGYTAAMPEVRSNLEQLLNNVAPGQLPTELDLAISEIMTRKMSRN